MIPQLLQRLRDQIVIRALTVGQRQRRQPLPAGKPGRGAQIRSGGVLEPAASDLPVCI
jgi:hypothetical protein